MTARTLDRLVMAVLICTGLGGVLLYSELLAKRGKQFDSNNQQGRLQ